MKKKIIEFRSFLLVLLSINIVGCQNNSKQKQGQPETAKLTQTAPIGKLSRNSTCDTTFVSQELSYGALAFEVFKSDTDKLKSLFLDRVNLKMVNQTNGQGGAYYQYSFTDGTNKIILFRNDGGFYIEDADIKNDRVLLNKKISIGMYQDAFLELLKIRNVKCDTINVTDKELTFESIYIFKDAKLQRIKMGQILE